MYDTTLRDGSQGEGMSLSCDDKLKIARELDAKLGVHYIEAGWPGSNPKDAEFFARARAELPLRHGAKLVAFGATRRKRTTCAADSQVQALLEAATPAITIVGKAWDFHVEQILDATLEENLAMIGDTVAYLKARKRGAGDERAEVMLDAEHFFDGYKSNPEYALACLRAAADAGADCLVLCDTNGGSTPWEVERVVREVHARFTTDDETPSAVRIGIHCHNDMELAVANSLAAVRGGATVVQGCVNGYGERTGNANLMSIIPTLHLRLGYRVLRLPEADALRQLTPLSRFVDEAANKPHVPSRPYVGESAFAHKGGLHVAAVMKHPRSYQFIEPELVGNRQRVLVSELSGRGNVASKMREFMRSAGAADRASFDEHDPVWRARLEQVLARVKALENKGFSFEGAEASLEMMIRRAAPDYEAPFEMLDFSVFTSNKRVLFVNHDGCFAPAEREDEQADEARRNGGHARVVGVDLHASAANSTESGSGGGNRVPLFSTSIGTDTARELTRDPSVAVWRNEAQTQALVKLLVHDDDDDDHHQQQQQRGADAKKKRVVLEAAEGNGPLDAVNCALRKALLPTFPQLQHVALDDYKVRILDQQSATAATTRVMIGFKDGRTLRSLTAVSADSNVIVASVNALIDGLESCLLPRRAEREH